MRIQLSLINASSFSRREHIQQEIEKEKMGQGKEEEVVEDFGDGYFAQYQKGKKKKNFKQMKNESKLN